MTHEDSPTTTSCPECAALVSDATVHADWHARTEVADHRESGGEDERTIGNMR